MERTALRPHRYRHRYPARHRGSTAGILSWMTAKRPPSTRRSTALGSWTAWWPPRPPTTQSSAAPSSPADPGHPRRRCDGHAAGGLYDPRPHPGPCSLWSPQTSSTPSSSPAFWPTWSCWCLSWAACGFCPSAEYPKVHPAPCGAGAVYRGRLRHQQPYL